MDEMKTKMLAPKKKAILPEIPKFDDIKDKEEEHQEVFKEVEYGDSLHRDSAWTTYVKTNNESKNIYELF
jgi:hypothetical protein